MLAEEAGYALLPAPWFSSVALAQPVLAHRVLPTAEAQIARRSADAIVTDVLRSVPVPRSVDTPPVGRRV